MRTLDPLRLIAIASYATLHTLLAAAAAIADRPWPDFLAALVFQQIRAPLQEDEIRLSIQSLTPITDNVSPRVRRQDEERPYPTWTTVAPVGAATLDRYVKVLCNDLTHIAGAQVKDVLVTGCGTGRHSINAARVSGGACSCGRHQPYEPRISAGRSKSI